MFDPRVVDDERPEEGEGDVFIGPIRVRSGMLDGRDRGSGGAECEKSVSVAARPDSRRSGSRFRTTPEGGGGAGFLDGMAGSDGVDGVVGVSGAGEEPGGGGGAREGRLGRSETRPKVPEVEALFRLTSALLSLGLDPPGMPNNPAPLPRLGGGESPPGMGGGGRSAPGPSSPAYFSGTGRGGGRGDSSMESDEWSRVFATYRNESLDAFADWKWPYASMDEYSSSDSSSAVGSSSLDEIPSV